MTREFSLGYLSFPGLPPPDLIRVAAGAGCPGVSLSAALSKMVAGQLSVLDDRAVRAETARGLRERNVRIDLVEGVSVSPDTDLVRARATLEVMREMGAKRFNLSIWDTDAGRAADQLSAFMEIGAALQMRITMEFTPLSQLHTLKDAAALTASGRYPGLQILVDALHLARAGEGPAEVAALPPGTVGFAQLCDGPAASPSHEAYFHEAMNERQIPGEGELPLRALLEALPSDIVVALEVPMRSKAEAGVSPLERAQLAMAGARRVAA